MVTRSGRSFTKRHSKIKIQPIYKHPTGVSNQCHDDSTVPRLHNSSSPPSWDYLPITTRYDLILRDTNIDFFARPSTHHEKTIYHNHHDHSRSNLSDDKQDFNLIYSYCLTEDLGRTKTCRSFKNQFATKVGKMDLAELFKSGKFKVKIVNGDDSKENVTLSSVKRCRTDSLEENDRPVVLKSAKYQNMDKMKTIEKFQCVGAIKSEKTPVKSGYHEVRRHSQGNAWTCESCDRVFVNYVAARSHSIAHTEDSNKCPVCGKVFSRSWILRGHMRTHSGEKPYRCEHCWRHFADRSNLRSHMLIHSTSSKDHICEYCNRAFAQKRYLVKHQQEVCNWSCSTKAEQNP